MEKQDVTRVLITTLVRIAVIATVLTVAGCAAGNDLPTFTAQDAMTAKAIAVAIGDTSVVQCYDDIAGTSAAIEQAKAGGTVGVLTGLQTKFAIQGQLKDPNCASLWLRIIAIVGKFTPAAPLIP